MLTLMLSPLLVATLRASTLLDPQPEHSSTLFGYSIAVVGDVDCDDVPDLAVEAPFQDGDFAGVPGFGPPQNAAPQWGTATLIETNSFKPPANLCKLAVNQNGDAMAVWQQGDSSGVSSIWANRYNAASGRWRTATLIESNAGKAFLPHVGMDDNGNAIAVWVQNDGTYDSMWANRYVAGQGWGTPELIETNTGDADFARVAVNGNGVAVALWKQSNGVNHDIWSNIYVPGQGWGTATLMEANPNDGSEPWVAVDKNGNAMAVWRQYNGGEPDPSIWARRYVAGQGWSTPTLIESNPGFASFPHVGFDDSGNAMVVWYQAFGAPNGRHIWANRYVVGTGWRTPTRIDSSDRNGQGPALAVNGNGNAVAVWHQWDDAGVAISIWANEYVAGQGWGTATLIETDSGAADNPDVAIDSGGNAIAVWRQFDGTADSIYANRYLAGQGWGTPTPIETGINGADIPRVAIDGNGNAIAIWQQKGSIWANRFASASSALTPTALTFTDVSTAAGFFGLNSSWCAAWGDYDNDGNLDVMTLGHNQANTGSISQLWHSNGDGTFTDVTTQAGLNPHNGDAHGVVWGDFDSDGKLDLHISKGSTKIHNSNNFNELWHNNGNGTFTNIAASAGVTALGHRTRGSYAVDYDGDSKLDIFATSFARPSGGGTNLLFHNNGDLTFTDMAMQAGLTRPGIENRTAAWADYNGDGFLDVFITRMSGLFRNNGNGTFTEVTTAAGIVVSGDAQAGAWGDYDNDGDPDLYVTFGVDTGSPVQGILYRNNGNGTFHDVTTQSGAVNIANALGATWADYDNDGFLDLYVVNSSNRANRLFHNNGDGTFTDVASTVGVEAKKGGAGTDASFIDYNNDGFLDLFVCNGAGNKTGPYLLFRNNGNRHNWLKVVLRGQQSNRGGIGAKLTLTAGGETQFREYTGQQHYMGQNHTPVHFGLGRATSANTLTIQWPSGTVDTLHSVPANSTIRVVEGSSP